MKLKTVKHIIEEVDQGKDLYSTYIEHIDPKSVPFKLSNEISNYLIKILGSGNNDKIIASLFLLSKFEKGDHFDFNTLSKFLKKRDYQIGLQAIQAFNNSNSTKSENILLDFIENPKSDSLGEDAVDVLAKNRISKEALERLIENFESLKGQTKLAVEYLIYRYSFNKELKTNEKLVEFITQKKMLPTEKYGFKGWQKSSNDKVEIQLKEWIEKILTKPSNKSNTSKKFYTIESEYYYSMYRLVVDHNPNTYITLQFGLHPLVNHAWGIKHTEFGLRLSKQIQYLGLNDFKKSFNGELSKWRELIKNEIEILEKSELDEIQLKSKLIDSSEPLNVHTYAGYINWLAFKGKKEEINVIGRRALSDENLKLNETWIEYFKNLHKITITNTM